MHLHKGGAHPRSRGENRSRARDLLGAGGSSPLTRGKQVSATFAANHRRLIPAHAGKTGCRRSGHGRRRAHPRSRGENTGSGFSCVCRRGSSPLTRGKRLGSGIEELADRLIPAHAGKTPAGQTLRGLATAHPRSRGENRLPVELPYNGGGSSPLTRGKRDPDAIATMLKRLIPAHAGKTSPPSSGRHQSRAHPRSRGENRAATSRLLSSMGSSPLTRGKPGVNSPMLFLSGLIPAHAGKTLPMVVMIGGFQAHPRSRGENPTCAFTAQIDQILETLELAVSSGSYSVWVACATDAPQDQVRSIGLVLPSSRGAS